MPSFLPHKIIQYLKERKRRAKRDKRRRERGRKGGRKESGNTGREISRA